MPGISSLPPPAKKQKISRNGEGTSKSNAQRIVELEKTISDALASNGSLNALTDLLQLASSIKDDDLVVKAIFAVYRSFILIAQKGVSSTVKDVDDDDKAGRKAVRSWVFARVDVFTELLSVLMYDDNKTIRHSSLRILFSLLRQFSNAIDADEGSSPLRFDVPLFQRIMRALLLSSIAASPASKRGSIDNYAETPPDVRDLLLGTWLNQYVDIRWFFLRETASLLEDADTVEKHPLLPANSLAILEKLSGMPTSKTTIKPEQFWIEGLKTKPKAKKRSDQLGVVEESDDDADGNKDDWRKFFDEPRPPTTEKGKNKVSRVHMLSVHAQLHETSAHRAVFTRCWLALLPFLSSGGETLASGIDAELDYANQSQLVLVSRALVVLHHGVLPHLTRPVLIMDWVASCVDYGGHVGLLALNTLFVLMQEYNLDYPSFYRRLYAFFTRDVLHLRFRARFFRLVELFLSSTHLPAALLASFIKRLARLSLFAPPAGVIIVIPFTYNVLKRHPALMCMIHRDEIVEKLDPFDAEEMDPMQTKALQSSLWELATHRQHYHAPVATLAKMFEEAFTRPGFAMEDFLDHTYSTLYETEVKRRIRKDPPVLDPEFVKPLILNAHGEEKTQNDVVSSMWTCQ